MSDLDPRVLAVVVWRAAWDDEKFTAQAGDRAPSRYRALRRARDMAANIAMDAHASGAAEFVRAARTETWVLLDKAARRVHPVVVEAAKRRLALPI